jgi:hypothetical protein
VTRAANDEAVRRLKAATDQALEGVVSALDEAGKPGKHTLEAMRRAISQGMAEAMDAGIAFQRAQSAPPPPPADTDITSTRPGFARRRSSRLPG